MQRTGFLRLWTLSLTFAAIMACQAPSVQPDHGVQSPRSSLAFRILKEDSKTFLRQPKYLLVTITSQNLKEPIKTNIQKLPQPGNWLLIPDAPIAERCVISIDGLNDKLAPIPAFHWATITNLGVGRNEAILNEQRTAAADAFLWMLRNHPKDAAEFDYAMLDYLVGECTKKFSLPSARLIDVVKLGQAVLGKTSKNIPEPERAWTVRPAKVSVRFTDYPPGLPVRIDIDDGLSKPLFNRTGGATDIEPVIPGDLPRELIVTPLEASSDLKPISVSFNVFPGELVTPSPLSFGVAKPLAAMPEPIGRAMYQTDASNQGMWLIGGLTMPSGFDCFRTLPGNDACTVVGATPSPIKQVPQPLLRSAVKASRKVYRYGAQGNWAEVGQLDETFPIYGVATARFENQIYGFGGFVNEEPDGRVHVINLNDRATLSEPFTLPALPGLDPRAGNRLVMANAVAATVGERIFVAGGFINPNVFALLNDKMLIFDPKNKIFPDVSAPGLPVPVQGASGAVSGNKWYVFGGYTKPAVPEGHVQILDTDALGWRKGLSMPTPRYGCGVVAVNNQLWVIGGEGRKGQPSRAVEVYDPVNDVWERRIPLKRGRSYPAVSVVLKDGKPRIIVAGGVAGDSPDGYPYPLDVVEELIP